MKREVTSLASLKQPLYSAPLTREGAMRVVFPVAAVYALSAVSVVCRTGLPGPHIYAISKHRVNPLWPLYAVCPLL